MNKQFSVGPQWKCWGVALLWGLAMPWAVAGPQQDHESGEKELSRGDLMAAMGLWRKAAQQGYAPAQSRLGDMLDKAEEDVEAVGWYRKAADQGDAAGEYGLGQMYAKGEGVKKDLNQARLYILRAAEKNHVDAVVMMMETYRAGGLGLTMDAAKADAWESKVVALIPGYKRPVVKAVGKAKPGDSK